MEIYFNLIGFPMKLITPSYEKDNFDANVAELSIVPEGVSNDTYHNPLFMLLDNSIDICTFKGREDTELVQYLNDIGFKFISTFYTLCLDRANFRETEYVNDKLSVEEAADADIERIYAIERNVFDYSTYQMDKRFPFYRTSARNVKRVASYMGKPNNHVFLIKRDAVILGFIQFLYDGDVAHAVNGAIDKFYHERHIGSLMYSKAFKAIFDSGVETITSGVSAQNIRALRIHQSCGFKIIDAEIHLRWIKE